MGHASEGHVIIILVCRYKETLDVQDVLIQVFCVNEEGTKDIHDFARGLVVKYLNDTRP